MNRGLYSCIARGKLARWTNVRALPEVPGQLGDRSAPRAAAARGGVPGQEATPNQERWAKNHQVDREFWNKLGDAGLLGLDLPEEYGGAGGDFGFSAVVAEEFALAHDSASGWSVHSPIVAHYIDTYGNAEQKARWMPKIISGETVLAIAMTEPGTGSDLQAVRTTAIRDGDHYVINGSKTFISNGSLCDMVVIVAKTDPTQGAAGCR